MYLELSIDVFFFYYFQIVRGKQKLLRRFDRGNYFNKLKIEILWFQNERKFFVCYLGQIFFPRHSRHSEPSRRSTDHQHLEATHQRHGRQALLRVPVGEVWFVWIHAPDPDPVGSGRPTGDWKVGRQSNLGARAGRVEKLVRLLGQHQVDRMKPTECRPHIASGIYSKNQPQLFKKIFISAR